jgi:hypothetical protein
MKMMNPNLLSSHIHLLPAKPRLRTLAQLLEGMDAVPASDITEVMENLLSINPTHPTLQLALLP